MHPHHDIGFRRGPALTRMLLQAASTVLAGALCAVAFAPPAHADVSMPISGNQQTTGWVNYATTRTVRAVSGTHLYFTADDLFTQPGGGGYLGLRLVNPGGGVISPSLAFTSPGRKAFGQFGDGTQFRFSAEGYSLFTNDTSWGGIYEARLNPKG